jgi:Rod binding domain-containing protein
MNLVSSAMSASQSVPDADRTRRAVHAAHEFEAVLLNTLLGALEHSFAALPGSKKTDPAADSYQAMGIQALATSLAGRGGIGIASRIASSLLRPAGQGPNGRTGPTKVSSVAADKPVSGTSGPRMPANVPSGVRIKGF